jgi:beta-galactosidase
MRILVTSLVFLLMFSGLRAERQKVLFNFDWRFSHQTDAKASQVNFDDDGWERVHLPHDASISGPFVKDSLNSDQKNGFLPRQKGWYRKVFTPEEDLSGKKIFFEFEGIYRDARVYLNGQEVAHQLNGYEGFLVDVTDVIQPGVSNVMAVSYDNTDMKSSRWYNGEGIYRDVWMLITNPVYVDYHGTYVHTPFVTDEMAKVALQTEVVNSGKESKRITLNSEIYGPDGVLQKTVVSTVPVGPGEIYVFRQSENIEQPQRWDIEHPALYEVRSRVMVDGREVDTYTTMFGIRTVEFTPEQGLLLNGRKVLAKGVNIHHDLGPLGAAAFERGFERRLEGLKRLGVNAIRLSHNPHDKYVLEWCDRNGMLVVDEPFDKWSDQFFGDGNRFKDHWEKSLVAFLKRDRNHPSIILWSAGNEVYQQKSSRSGFGVPMLKEVYAFIRSFEPSRSITVGLHPSRRSGAYRSENYYREGPPEMVFYMDVVSTNYREEFWPMDKANHPQLIFMLSEAQVGNLGNEWFNFDHRSSVGLFYWGGTDYIGESFGWPSKGWANGIIDWNDHWKSFSYYINSLFSEEPMVHIAAFDDSDVRQQYWNEVQLRYQPLYSHWNWADRDSVDLYTFTNGQEVELFVNGRSHGVLQVPEEYHTKDIRAYTAEEYDPENPITLGPAMHKQLAWRIPYEAGVIEAVSKIDGQEVARHRMETAGSPARIVLEADREVINADGLDLSYITVKVVDENGILVPNAAHAISFRVNGAGSNAGVGNADVISGEPFVADNRKAFQGKALLIVRSTREAGTIKVRAVAKGLKTAHIEVVTQ